ncbi:hypothetical protein C2G38_2257913 [Gigaspora rosea]|uniref:Uncharacterized protein n=1 Tax=Gigaspora rosea TaxID=44941 RepID=A0A397UQ92_9GLOM|nr:hypothetical protein C2G38_2257913 [Gigaspora rosea]
MLIRALTPEQGEEFQELNDENLDNTLNDEQIFAALDFILEVLKYAITKNEKNPRQKNKRYNGWPNVRYYKAKIKKNYFLVIQEEEAVYLGVLDPYYDLDKAVKKPLKDARFGSNIEQNDKLEVLLKEVATECDTLIQELVPKEKKLIREPKDPQGYRTGIGTKKDVGKE